MSDKESIVEWCQQYVATLLNVPATEVDPDADFDRLGLDSALAVSLLVEIEEKYDIDLPPEELFENPNLNAVADYILLHTRGSVSSS